MAEVLIVSPALDAVDVEPEGDPCGSNGGPKAHKDAVLGLLEDEVDEDQLAGGPTLARGLEDRVLELPVYHAPAGNGATTKRTACLHYSLYYCTVVQGLEDRVLELPVHHAREGKST